MRPFDEHHVVRLDFPGEMRLGSVQSRLERIAIRVACRDFKNLCRVHAGCASAGRNMSTLTAYGYKTVGKARHGLAEQAVLFRGIPAKLQHVTEHRNAFAPRSQLRERF